MNETTSQLDLGETFCTHHLALRNYIRERVTDTETANDIAAGVWERTATAVQARHVELASPTGYLYQAARNAIIDHCRSHARRKFVSFSELQMVGAGDPAQRVEVVCEAARAREAMQRLTPLQREVVRLRFLEGLETLEVSALTGLSEQAVKAAQHRAIRRLRLWLGAGREVDA